MRTIQTQGTVTEDRRLTVELPPDIAPGDHQVIIVIDEVPADELRQDLALLAERGGSLDWLHDEPDIYTDEDGEPVRPSARHFAVAMSSWLCFRDQRPAGGTAARSSVGWAD